MNESALTEENKTGQANIISKVVDWIILRVIIFLKSSFVNFWGKKLGRNRRNTLV
jgi:hypothetical protein